MQSSHYMLLPIGGHRAGRRIAFAKLEPADYEWAVRYRWSILRGKRTLYAWRSTRRDGSRTRVLMHRELLGLPAGQDPEVDHRNGNGLDNRRSNLRTVVSSQNNQNRQGAKRGTPSGVRGVSREARRGKWRAQAELTGRQYHLGYFDTIGEAEAVVVAWRRAHMPFSEMDLSPCASAR